MVMGKIREIRVCGEVAYVPLTNGYEAMIDAADVPLVQGWNWYAHIGGNAVYARRDIRTKAVRRNIRMHQVILSVGDGMTPDHIDRNGLNNRRANLRPASMAQQRENQGVAATNVSGFKGVAWDASRQKYRATIKRAGKSRHLGYFDTPECAAKAYAEACAG